MAGESVSYKKMDMWRKFSDLPEKIQKTIFSSETAATLISISIENRITDKIEKLNFSVNLILSGVVHITSFRQTLQDELQLDEDNARKIAIEVRDKIFMGVKDELRKIHNLE
jgi:hypothetical protein